MELPQIINRNYSKISKKYKNIIQEKYDCSKCTIRNNYNLHPVLSEGNALDPTFMIIGEAPGREESCQCKPFVGQSGQLLREVLKIYKEVFNRKTTIITNVLGCRPTSNKFPENKYDKKTGINPYTDTTVTCVKKWLNNEILILKPKVIITLGNHALFEVTGEKGITKKRGIWNTKRNTKEHINYLILPTYHPSYVIRQKRDGNEQVYKDFEIDIATVAIEYENRLEQMKSDIDPQYDFYKSISWQPNTV